MEERRPGCRRTAGRAGVLLGGLLMGFGLLEVFVTATIGGLWLVLLGWFLSSAARAKPPTRGCVPRWRASESATR